VEDLVDIAQKVSNKWREIGFLTGQENFIDGYETKSLKDSTLCCQWVFKKWIDDDGCKDYPITWQGLYDLLCDVGYRGMANKLAADKAKNITLRR
jgi:hypothetical protein